MTTTVAASLGVAGMSVVIGPSFGISASGFSRKAHCSGDPVRHARYFRGGSARPAHEDGAGSGFSALPQRGGRVRRSPPLVEIDAASADSYVAGLPRAELPGGESQ